MQLNLAKDFSPAPGGRYREDGPTSATAFRDDLLIPRLHEAIGAGEVLIVNLDGAIGVPSSFLEEAFGGLIRADTGLDSQTIMQSVTVVAKDPNLWPFMTLAERFMERAAEDKASAPAPVRDTDGERPLSETTDLFVGKTIQKVDASADNNVEFLFTDGTRVALHIECDGMGLPSVMTCTHCAEIEA